MLIIVQTSSAQLRFWNSMGDIIPFLVVYHFVFMNPIYQNNQIAIAAMKAIACHSLRGFLLSALQHLLVCLRQKIDKRPHLRIDPLPFMTE